MFYRTAQFSNITCILMFPCCRVFDCRAAGQYKQWVAGAGCEVERVAWDHFSPHRVLASTDQGQVVCVDVR